MSLLVGCFGLAVLTGLMASNYWISIFVLAGVYTIVATGLNLFMGYTGQTSFGHNAFAAVGGYSTAILTTFYGWPPILAMVFGALLAAAIAAAIGYSIVHLKVRGHYLGMVTLGLGLITVELAIEMDKVTNGTQGIAGIPGFGIGGYEITTSRGMYWLMVFLAPLAIWCAHRISTSRVGRALIAISADEQAAEAIGINTSAHILLAFVVSAAFAAIGGSLLAHQLAFVSPEVFGMFFLTLLFTALFVGGIGTTFGPLVGALLMVLTPEALRGFSDFRELIYGGFLMTIIVFAPGGLCSSSTWTPLLKWFARPAGRLSLQNTERKP
jgi:branched-chain amino acid transport system permease protein